MALLGTGNERLPTQAADGSWKASESCTASIYLLSKRPCPWIANYWDRVRRLTLIVIQGVNVDNGMLEILNLFLATHTCSEEKLHVNLALVTWSYLCDTTFHTDAPKPQTQRKSTPGLRGPRQLRMMKLPTALCCGNK